MRKILDDFLPFQIHINTDPIIVSWIECKSLKFDEPVFNQSIKQLKRSGENTKIINSSLDELFDYAKALDTTDKIKGFVFHTSRCGSTMVVNALRNCDSAYVISESQLFSSVMLPENCGFWSNQKNIDIDFRYKIFASLENIFLHFFKRRDANAKLFIKFSSWNILSLDWLMKHRLNTPCLIVFRNPIETLVSLLRKPPGFYYMKNSDMCGPNFTESITNVPVQRAQFLNLEEYLARTLNTFYQIASRPFTGADIKRINYNKLSLDSIIDVANFFGIETSDPKFADSMRDQLVKYSKNSSIHYVDDSGAKQKIASNVVKKMVDAYCMEGYTSLNATCR